MPLLLHLRQRLGRVYYLTRGCSSSTWYTTEWCRGSRPSSVRTLFPRSATSNQHLSTSAAAVADRAYSAPQQVPPSQPLDVLHVLRLNHLQDNPGAVHTKRRKGRGVGSSKGKTCGRGHKGQKAKENIHPLFEGGQTKLYKLLPKRGFKNTPHQAEMVPLKLSTLQLYIDMGRLDANKEITLHSLLEAGIFKASAVKHGVKLLGDTTNGAETSSSVLRQPIRIRVSRASASAIEAVEQCGGQITTVHYNRLALRQLLRPHKFDQPVRQARPPLKWQPYYTSWKKRGYLNPIVQMQQWLEQRPEHVDTFQSLTKDLK